MTSALQPLLTAAFAAWKDHRAAAHGHEVAGFLLHGGEGGPGLPGMAAMTAAPPMS